MNHRLPASLFAIQFFARLLRGRFLRGLLALAAVAEISASITAGAAQPAVASLGGLPLCFEVNQGQSDCPAQFLARGLNYQFLLSPAETLFVLRHVDEPPPASPFDREKRSTARQVASRTVRMKFLGANSQAPIRGVGEMPGKVNYLIGNIPEKWHCGIATYAKVGVEGIYPGVNLVYYGNQQQLEYDFAIAPDVDPAAIAIRFDGADEVSVETQGDLVLKLGGEEIRLPRPSLYQLIGGTYTPVDGGYRIEDARTVRFAIGKYDHHLPLIIDPILAYSTYFGGNVGDNALAVALDGQGNVYLAGETLSTKFPFTPTGTYQTNFHGGLVNGDAFVAKFDNSISTNLYYTYLGGSNDDGALSMTVDQAGHAYVTGFTDSPNFPVQPQTGLPGFSRGAHLSGGTNAVSKMYPDDIFVSELETNGASLIFSTYLGGSDQDVAGKIAVDSAGNAYVTGYTQSTNFPTTVNAYQTNPGGYYTNDYNAFISEISTNGLLYSSYIGGTNVDLGEGIAVYTGYSSILGHASGGTNIAYVSGYTLSTNFPTTSNALQPFLNKTNVLTYLFDAFVAVFDTSASGAGSLVYSSFLGGTNSDAATRIAVDDMGDAYVTGWTYSPDFPNTVSNVPGLYLSFSNNVGYNAFLTKIAFNTNTPSVIASNTPAIAYSVVFGGTNNYDMYSGDLGWDLALDSQRNAYVIGHTASTNFPTFNTAGFLSAANAGSNDVFVTVFNADASALIYSIYLGGSGDDFGQGIAVDPLRNAYIIGRTLSTNFPTVTPFTSPLQKTNNAFLAKISMDPTLTAAPAAGNSVRISWPVSPFAPEYGRYSLKSTTNHQASIQSQCRMPIPPNSSACNGAREVLRLRRHWNGK